MHHWPTLLLPKIFLEAGILAAQSQIFRDMPTSTSSLELEGASLRTCMQYFLEHNLGKPNPWPLYSR